MNSVIAPVPSAGLASIFDKGLKIGASNTKLGAVGVLRILNSVAGNGNQEIRAGQIFPGVRIRPSSERRALCTRSPHRRDRSPEFLSREDSECAKLFG